MVNRSFEQISYRNHLQRFNADLNLESEYLPEASYRHNLEVERVRIHRNVAQFMIALGAIFIKLGTWLQH